WHRRSGAYVWPDQRHSTRRRRAYWRHARCRGHQSVHRYLLAILIEVVSANHSDQSPAEKAWRLPSGTASLSEVHRTIPVPTGLSFWRKMLAFSGPGYLVAVGYMDPGNWATDLAGGSKFGYMLLSIVLLSNLMAILLQALAAKLGIVTGRDLAQACRDHYSR